MDLRRRWSEGTAPAVVTAYKMQDQLCIVCLGKGLPVLGHEHRDREQLMSITRRIARALARLLAGRAIAGVATRLREELVAGCRAHRAATVQHLLKARIGLADIMKASGKGEV